MVWPSTELVKEFGSRYPLIRIILQMNKVALGQVDNDPEKLLRKLDEYGSFVDYLLFDCSMGRGVPMDSEEILGLLRPVAEGMPHVGLAAAGGLGPDTLHLVEPLVDEFPNLFLDAQGNLRESGNSLDPIDWKRAHKYIRGAVKMFADRAL